MPDKPTWTGHFGTIQEHLRALPDPWIDRAQLEGILGIGRRRAQQILAPCVSRWVGSNGLAERETLIAHLDRLTTGETAYYEKRRRERFVAQLDVLRQERAKAVLVAAPASVVNQDLDCLPSGVSVEPGAISIRFNGVPDALTKLLALAMAIRNNEALFERMATGQR